MLSFFEIAKPQVGRDQRKKNLCEDVKHAYTLYIWTSWT